MQSLTPGELRTWLASPSLYGNKKEFLRAVAGILTEKEAKAFEHRINALNEQVDDPVH